MGLFFEISKAAGGGDSFYELMNRMIFVRLTEGGLSPSRIGAT